MRFLRPGRQGRSSRGPLDGVGEQNGVEQFGGFAAAVVDDGRDENGGDYDDGDDTA